MIEELIALGIHAFTEGFGGRIAPAYVALHLALLELAPLLKHTSFREEREWRLISESITARLVATERAGGELSADRPELRVGHSMIVPYLAVPILERIDALRSVIVGPSRHVDLASLAAQIAAFRSGRAEAIVKSSTCTYRAI